jgi:hypothetical protein
MNLFDLQMHSYQSAQHFVAPLYRLANSKNLRGAYCLLTAHEHRLVAVSNHLRSVNALTGFNLVADCRFNSADDHQFEFDLNFACLWRRDGVTAWVRDTQFDASQLDQYLLLGQQVAALDTLNDTAQMLFARIGVGNLIYEQKYLEAMSVIERGISQDQTGQYLYVSGYARIEGISIEVAARRIQFKYEDAKGRMAEIENMRLAHQKAILAVERLEQLKPLMETLEAQIDKYASL